MWKEAHLLFLYLHNFFFQVFYPCYIPEQLLVNTIQHQQFLGKWYFRAAVSHREADIHKFRALDNLWFNMEETANDTLLLTGHMRTRGDDCIKQTWTYRIHPERDDLELEGNTQRRNLLWSGKWANCPECIVFQEIEPPLSPYDSEDSLSRLMLYTRQSDVNAEAEKVFLKNTACRNASVVVSLPQEKEFCT